MKNLLFFTFFLIIWHRRVAHTMSRGKYMTSKCYINKALPVYELQSLLVRQDELRKNSCAFRLGHFQAKRTTQKFVSTCFYL